MKLSNEFSTLCIIVFGIFGVFKVVSAKLRDPQSVIFRRVPIFQKQNKNISNLISDLAKNLILTCPIALFS